MIRQMPNGNELRNGLRVGKRRERHSWFGGVIHGSEGRGQVGATPIGCSFVLK